MRRVEESTNNKLYWFWFHSCKPSLGKKSARTVNDVDASLPGWVLMWLFVSILDCMSRYVCAWCCPVLVLKVFVTGIDSLCLVYFLEGKMRIRNLHGIRRRCSKIITHILAIACCQRCCHRADNSSFIIVILLINRDHFHSLWKHLTDSQLPEIPLYMLILLLNHANATYCCIA